MAHQATLQNSKNSTTLHEILDEDIQYYQSINKNLSTELLVELARLLLQQRAELRQENNKIGDKLANLEAELNEEKSHGQEMEEHLKTMQEECENLRNLISYKEQQSEKRFNELSQESSLMLEEVAGELKKQRQTNMQLKNLLKQIKNKQNQIRKLSISLTKVNEENESLKKVKNINILLSQQFLQSQQKLIQLREAQHQLRNQNQELRDKINELEDKVVETQFALNQITKAKQIISEQLEKRDVKQNNNTKYKQNAELLKQIENNFDTEIFGQHSDKDSPERIIPVNQKNEIDFENSLDNVSQNWDKISIKEIQASSKGKHFGSNIFNLDAVGDQVKAFQVTKKKNLQTPIQKLYQKDEESIQFNHIPLSIDRKQKNKYQKKHEYQTVGKPKQYDDIKIEAQTPLESHRSVQNAFTPQAQIPMGIKKHTKANSEFKQQQLKEREVQHLNKRLQQYKKMNSDLQSQVLKLQSRLQEQVTEFKQEIQKQIDTIERLASELKQQKIYNIDETRRKDQQFAKNLLSLTERCQDYENEIEENKRVIEHDKKAFDELYSRLMQMQEEKYQHRMNESYQNGHKIDQCIQTLRLLSSLSFQQVFNQVLHTNLPKKSSETNTQALMNTSFSTQTIQPSIISKQINTVQTYSYKGCDRDNQSTNTQAKICVNYLVQVQHNQLIKYENKQVQNCALMKNTATGDYLIERFDKGIQAGENKKKFSLYKLEQKVVKKQLPIKQECSTQTQNRNNGENEKEPEKKLKQKQENEKAKDKQNWPIRKFNPTPISQQLAQQAFSSKQFQQKPFTSECEQEKPSVTQSNTREKQITLYLLKLNIILVNKTKKLKNVSLPNLNNVKINRCYQLNDIINKYKDTTAKSKQYFVLYTIITRDNQLVPDRVLLWREGMVSLYFGGTFLMTGTKKYIYDPVNVVLGNCEIIVAKHLQTVQVRRATKNYFVGEIEDCIWRVLSVEAYGQY